MNVTDKLNRAIWSHWKINVLLTENGLYKQANSQKHHLRELELRSRQARIDISDSELSISARIRAGSQYMRNKGTLFFLKLGESPKLLLVFALAIILLFSLVYPLFGIQSGGVVYRYRLMIPSSTAIIKFVTFSLERFIEGFLAVLWVLIGQFLSSQPPDDIFQSAIKPVGAAAVFGNLEWAAGVLFGLAVLATLLRRLLLYGRSRADSEAYGGLAVWLLGR